VGFCTLKNRRGGSLRKKLENKIRGGGTGTLRNGKELNLSQQPTFRGEYERVSIRQKLSGSRRVSREEYLSYLHTR